MMISNNKVLAFVMRRYLTLLMSAMLLFWLVPLGSLATAEEADPVRFFILSGPTGIGAMPLWAKSESGETENSYEVTMTGANDEIVAAVSTGAVDIAAIATNLASVLYNRTSGEVQVLAVNTLGVLSILSSSREQVSSIADLKGRTIVAPGQGANPEYILRYVLSHNGLDPDRDVSISYVSEGSELLTVWANDPNALILAPQPVASSILMQHENAAKIFDMTEEWNLVSGGESQLMMGCVIARKDYIESHPTEITAFLRDYEASIKQAEADIDGTAALCEHYGLIPKAALAKRAIPQCSLTFITGEELADGLGGYLQVMFDSNPRSIGGAMPGDDFYYVSGN